MSQEPFPGHGQGGDEPQPGSGMGNGSRDAGGALEGGRGPWDVDDDFDLDASMDRLMADVEAGRIQVPPAEPIVEGLTVSLVEIADLDAAGLAGLDMARFAQGGAADTMAPCSALTALAEAACQQLDQLTDNEVLGLAGAGRKLAGLATWIELSAASQFAVRRRSGDAPGTANGPGNSQGAAEFLRRLRVELAPIARGGCDHASYEAGYRPSRKLKHLIRARTARCHFRGCSQPAADCDADHTVPRPAGPTCQCNLGPPCRHHHRCKQDPGWKLEQPEPGVMIWTGPSGRRHSTRPTRYIA